MFQRAVTKASAFTKPVVVCVRRESGQVATSCGAFIVLNDDGWIATAAHMFELRFQADKDKAERDLRDQAIRDLENDSSLMPKRRSGLIKQHRTNPAWISACSYWWADDAAKLTDLAINAAADIAVGRLQPFAPGSVGEFPVLGDSARRPISPGAMLCRLGFPFHEVKASWVDPGSFQIDPATFPMPLFPFEGMYTRQQLFSASGSSQQARFLEMSSPGLRGQSGGPIFDTDGVVWAIQSRTLSLPLGFQPTVPGASKPQIEHQFINLGLGGSVDELRQILAGLGVSHQ